MATTNKKPATTFKHGTVKAAVWENTGKDGLFYSVTFSRSYKDAEGNWRNTSSFGGNDLEDLSRASCDANLWILSKKQ